MRWFRRRRRIDRALIAALAAENTALRHALAELGRQLHQTQTGPCGDTVPMPRVRSRGAHAMTEATR